ncbi:unnamed protein product [marine sediment metagenome]|uniref:dTDP-4-dehydrorhamnose 3,5-epimerase n=1 Tax=marine sediment metagenome TaxID=412755 RepID=X0TW33_9ZZZZ
MMIEGVATKKLKPVVDERGTVMEILRCDDELFEKFGQAYTTTCHPGIVKAWHCHKKQTDHFCCVAGTAKVVLWDGRHASPTFREICEFFIGVRNPLLLKIPPGVFHGFCAVGNEEVTILNCPTNPYNHDQPDEIRRPSDDPEIGYDWSPKNG